MKLRAPITDHPRFHPLWFVVPLLLVVAALVALLSDERDYSAQLNAGLAESTMAPQPPFAGDDPSRPAAISVLGDRPPAVIQHVDAF